jgi:hypothetical protein
MVTCHWVNVSVKKMDLQSINRSMIRQISTTTLEYLVVLDLACAEFRVFGGLVALALLLSLLNNLGKKIHSSLIACAC